jgi:hypothetical protein
MCAACDTDSMTIVATEHGGLVPCLGGAALTDGAAIRALSWQGVREMAGRFCALNPYAPDAVPGSILKIEDENFDKLPASSERTNAMSFQRSDIVYSTEMRQTRFSTFLSLASMA